MSFDVRNITPGTAPLPVREVTSVQGKFGQKNDDSNIIGPDSNTFYAPEDVVELSETAKAQMEEFFHEDQDVNYRKETSVDLSQPGAGNTAPNIFQESQYDILAGTKFKAEVDVKRVLSEIGALYDELI